MSSRIPNVYLIVQLILIVIAIGSVRIISAQMQMGNSTVQCETCPMKVTPEEQAKFKVTDGNGTAHNVDCFGCALKLIPKYSTLHIETYCDYYGPDYKIIVDITQSRQVISVTPSTALFLTSGGCTGNRVAYNQTAAGLLLKQGFTQYTVTMQRQALPTKTNTTTIEMSAAKFATNTSQSTPTATPNPMLLVGAILGIALIGIVAYKKVIH